MLSHVRKETMLLAVLVASAGCSGTETPPEEHATPVNAKLFIQNVEVTPNITLLAGQSVRVEVRFLDDQGAVIDGLETEHYTALTFSPASLATTAAVANQRFFVDVTVQASSGATGTVSVGYGHDDLADEGTFGPFAVTVQ